MCVCVCVCVWARGEVAVGPKTSHENEIHYIRNAIQDIEINRRIPQNFGDIFIIWSIYSLQKWHFFSKEFDGLS